MVLELQTKQWSPKTEAYYAGVGDSCPKCREPCLSQDALQSYLQNNSASATVSHISERSIISL